MKQPIKEICYGLTLVKHSLTLVKDPFFDPSINRLIEGILRVLNKPLLADLYTD